MMKHFYSTRLLFPLFFGIAFLGSCDKHQEDPVIPEDTPEVVIQETELSIDKNGGTIEVGFDIKNPIDTIALAVQTNNEWVSASIADNIISLTVNENTSYDTRVSEIQLSYGEYFTGKLIVEQTGEIYPSYQITIKDISSTTIIMDIVPSRDDLSYMIRPIRKDILDTYTSDENFFAAELEYIRHMEEDENTPLSSMVKKGDALDYEALYLDTDSEYVICAYAIGEDGSFLSDVCKSETVRTEAIEITLKASATASSITVDMTASDQKAPVYFGVVSKDYLEEHNQTLEDAIYWAFWMEFYTAKELWQRNTIDHIPVMGSFGSGNKTISSYVINNQFTSVLADSEYIVWATTINHNGESGMKEAATIEIRTEKGALSDNEITVEISNITATSWDFKAITTNNDPYIIYWHYKSEFDGMSDEEAVENISKRNLTFYTYKGNKSSTYGNKTPDTEYSMFIFGFEGGEITTEFQRFDIKTLPQ